MSQESFETPQSRAGIFREIEQERRRQDKKHGGPDHDDQNTAHDWIAFVTYFLGLSIRGEERWSFNNATYRQAMVKIAALAVAAIEWCDRRTARSAE
jgi:hypothetical protein